MVSFRTVTYEVFVLTTWSGGALVPLKTPGMIETPKWATLEEAQEWTTRVGKANPTVVEFHIVKHETVKVERLRP